MELYKETMLRVLGSIPAMDCDRNEGLGSTDRYISVFVQAWRDTKEESTMKMTCDNDCTRAGWTEAIVTSGMDDLHVSHAPDADLDGEFDAFCHDEQEMISIKGWMIGDYALVEEDEAS